MMQNSEFTDTSQVRNSEYLDLWNCTSQVTSQKATENTELTKLEVRKVSLLLKVTIDSH